MQITVNNGLTRVTWLGNPLLFFSNYSLFEVGLPCRNSSKTKMGSIKEARPGLKTSLLIGRNGRRLPSYQRMLLKRNLKRPSWFMRLMKLQMKLQVQEKQDALVVPLSEENAAFLSSINFFPNTEFLLNKVTSGLTGITGKGGTARVAKGDRITSETNQS